MVNSKLINIIRYIGAIPRSYYINFRLLPFKQAIKLPILVSRKTIVSSLKGHVTLKKYKTGSIRLGFGSIRSIDYYYQRSILHIEGEITFDGKCKLGRAFKVIVQPNAHLHLGQNFSISGNASILCHKHIKFGDDCLVAWESTIMDTDHHDIFDAEGHVINEDKEIIIGNKVWIGAKSMILKGSQIASGSIVASSTTLSKAFSQNNIILGGNPARVIKKDISW